jgi:hypothetical protein
MEYKVKCNSCQAMGIMGVGTHEIGCTDTLFYIDSKGMEWVYFDVWTLDVWGNAREGFEVNDRSRLRERLFVRRDSSDKELLKALKDAGLLNKRCHFKSFSVHGDDAQLFIDSRKTGEPIYQLEVA